MHTGRLQGISCAFALVVATAGAWSCGGAQDGPTATLAQAGSAPYGAGAESFQSEQAGGNLGLGQTDVSMSGGKCPMVMKDTQVRAEDTERGVALAFTTPSGDVGELRQAVRDMARRHELRSQQRWGGGMGRGWGRRAGPGPLPPATVEVQDIAGGARVVYTPLDPANLGALREAVYRRQALLDAGSCPMALGPA